MKINVIRDSDGKLITTYEAKTIPRVGERLWLDNEPPSIQQEVVNVIHPLVRTANGRIEPWTYVIVTTVLANININFKSSHAD